ncbi:hypothetical protein F4780DRAFT_779477 [Xylariomycetidae sp. FL0641]|nr:hypothetical protein F4780DRAFT_779477 [Xylariomycetidae sp. FL0641]
MKAPHPAGPMPHRGYSGTGVETVYSQDVRDHEASGDAGFGCPAKSFLVPQAHMAALYQRLAAVSTGILAALIVGLSLNATERDAATSLISVDQCQLRLLCYSEITMETLQDHLLARLPSHNGQGTMTLLFQDSNDGLELKDPRLQEFLHAEPEEGSLVLNAGQWRHATALLQR